jgi:hypothetical protein
VDGVATTRVEYAMGPRVTILWTALTALAAAPPAGRAATESEPLLFFAEDWTRRGGDFPAARAAREAFLGWLAEPAVEDFEGLAGRVIELPFGGYGARITGGPRDSVSTTLALTPGRRATSARRYYEHASPALVVELEHPAEAVGFYGIDVGDAGGRLRVTVRAADGWERSFPVAHTVVPRGDGRGEGAVLFFGLVAPGRRLVRLELENVGDPGDGFGYDDLVVGRLGRPVV